MQSQAQRYMFFAERQAAKIDGLPEDTATRPVKKVGIIGAGTMGGGIAHELPQRRHPGDHRRDASRRRSIAAPATIRKNYENTAAKGGA